MTFPQALLGRSEQLAFSLKATTAKLSRLLFGGNVFFFSIFFKRKFNLCVSKIKLIASLGLCVLMKVIGPAAAKV